MSDCSCYVCPDCKERLAKERAEAKCHMVHAPDCDGECCEQPSPAGEGAQVVRDGAAYVFPNAYANPEPFFDKTVGEGAQETPLLTYLTTNNPDERAAAFLRTYATRLRDGTAQSWEIPNTVASTLEDIARRLDALPPERAALAERRSYYANALDLVAETLAELKPEELEPRGPKLIAIIRNAAAALRGETGDGP